MEKTNKSVHKAMIPGNNRQINAPRGIYYGYIIVLLMVVIQIVMYSQRSSFGVFIKPLENEFGWSRALITGAFSFSTIVQGFSAIIMGGLNDRVGPRITLTLCGFLTGLGLLLISCINSAWQLYLYYTILIGLGMGGLTSPLMSTVVKWFVKRRNVMTSMILVGGGIGGLIGPPVINWLINNQGLRDCFTILGISVLFGAILSAQFLKLDPSKIGQLPYGKWEETSKPYSNVSGLSLVNAIHTKQFWMVAGAIFCFGFVASIIITHIVPYATDLGISTSTAANILAITNGALSFGAIIIGVIADRIGVRRSSILCFTLLSVVLFLLLPVNNSWLIALFTLFTGIGSGGISALLPAMTAEFFGMKFHGLILGVFVLSYTVGMAIGSFTGGYLSDIYHDYFLTFLFGTILSFTGLLLVIILRADKKVIDPT